MSVTGLTCSSINVRLKRPGSDPPRPVTWPEVVATDAATASTPPLALWPAGRHLALGGESPTSCWGRQKRWGSFRGRVHGHRKWMEGTGKGKDRVSMWRPIPGRCYPDTQRKKQQRHTGLTRNQHLAKDDNTRVCVCVCEWVCECVFHILCWITVCHKCLTGAK